MSNTYNINYESSEIQAMSEEKASAYKLWKTVNEYLGGGTMFFSFCEQAKYTYEDIASYIGCDATNYHFDTANKARAYTWVASDNETAKFSAFFTDKEGDGKWTLKFTGSANLITKPDAPEEEEACGSDKKTPDDINVDDIIDGFKEDLKKEFSGTDGTASTLAGTLLALMGAGLFAAGLSSMGNAQASKNEASDLSSCEPQKLSDIKATSDTLKKTHSEWLDGKYTFVGTAYELLTYDSFKEHIGCEATVFYYDKIQNARVYTWISEDDPQHSLCVWFKKKGENWTLYLITPQ